MSYPSQLVYNDTIYQVLDVKEKDILGDIIYTAENNGNTVIIGIDEDGNILYVNPTLETTIKFLNANLYQMEYVKEGSRLKFLELLSNDETNWEFIGTLDDKPVLLSYHNVITEEGYPIDPEIIINLVDRVIIKGAYTRFNQEILNELPGKKYTLTHGAELIFSKKLGEGSQGVVFSGFLNGDNVAIKVAFRSSGGRLHLSQEEDNVSQINKNGNISGIPKYYGYYELPGKNPLYILIMQKLGISLETIHNDIGRLAKGQVLDMLRQVLVTLRDIHRAGYLHEDIKPGNIMLNPEMNKYYLIDYGIATKILSSSAQQVLSEVNTQEAEYGVRGTPIFSSRGAQTGLKYDYIDDIEGLIYTAIYLYEGFLPWQPITRLSGVTLREISGLIATKKQLYFKNTSTLDILTSSPILQQCLRILPSRPEEIIPPKELYSRLFELLYI